MNRALLLCTHGGGLHFLLGCATMQTLIVVSRVIIFAAFVLLITHFVLKLTKVKFELAYSVLH